MCTQYQQRWICHQCPTINESNEVLCKECQGTRCQKLDKAGQTTESNGPTTRQIFGYVALGALGIGIGYMLRGAGEAQQGTAELVRSPGELKQLWNSSRGGPMTDEEREALAEAGYDEEGNPC